MDVYGVIYPLVCCVGVVFLIAAVVAAILLIAKKKMQLALLIGIPLLCIGCSVILVVTYLWWNHDTYIPDDLSDSDTVNDYDDDYYDYDDSSDDYSDDFLDDSALDDDYVEVGPGYVTNDEYNFSVYVGDYDLGEFVGSQLEGTVETLSYCVATSESTSEMGSCDAGYFPIFDITVMTWDQWADYISEDTMGMDMYVKIGDDADNVYLFSHPNGDYPSDLSISDEYFDAVIVSFETSY